jgi:peptide subunit release factor RF-3
MIRELTPPLDAAKLRRGEQTAVFFGSAMTDAGVEPFLRQAQYITIIKEISR